MDPNGSTVVGKAPRPIVPGRFVINEKLPRSLEKTCQLTPRLRVAFRDASMKDVAADAAGTASGLAAAAVVSCWLARPGRRLRHEPVSVTLVTGPHCPLCQEARDALRRIGRRLPLRVEERSVADSEQLAVRYRLQVPVVLVKGRRLSKGRVDEARLAASLAARVGRSV